MKPQAEFVARLAADLRDHALQFKLTYSELAKRTGVHESQVSRILNGHFKTLGHSVRRICKELQLDPDDLGKSAEGLDPLAIRIQQSAIELWDHSSEDAERIVELMRQLTELRRQVARS